MVQIKYSLNKPENIQLYDNSAQNAVLYPLRFWIKFVQFIIKI